VGLPPAADEWGGPPPGDAGALPALHPEPDPLRIVAARGPAVGPHPTAFRGVADGPAPPAATLGNGPPALADTAHVWPAPVDVRPFAAARSSGAPREADVPAAGPVRLAPLPVSQPAAATAERLPPSASAEQPPAPAADGGLPGPRSPGAEVALEDREPSVGLRLPLPAPLAGTLPLDLAAVRDGAREFFGRIADLAAGPERGGWSRLYYLSAGVAVFAAGLAFRAVARQPRRPAPGPALSSFVRSPGVVR
jgi:hypothetical protein